MCASRMTCSRPQFFGALQSRLGRGAFLFIAQDGPKNCGLLQVIRDAHIRDCHVAQAGIFDLSVQMLSDQYLDPVGQSGGAGGWCHGVSPFLVIRVSGSHIVITDDANPSREELVFRSVSKELLTGL